MESRSISRLATPVLIAFIGLGLALVEGVYDLFNAELYTGELNGVVVTETDIIVSTAVGMILVLIAAAYLYSQRFEPTKRTYAFVAVLGALSLVIGVLFSTVIVIVAAVVGYFTVRRTTTEQREPAGLSHPRID